MIRNEINPYSLQFFGETADHRINASFPVVINKTNDLMLRHSFVGSPLIITYEQLEEILEQSNSLPKEQIDGLPSLIRIIKIAYNKFKIKEVEEGLEVDII